MNREGVGADEDRVIEEAKPLKPTPIWDDLGWSGMNREGEGPLEIAKIRKLKGKRTGRPGGIETLFENRIKLAADDAPLPSPGSREIGNPNPPRRHPRHGEQPKIARKRKMAAP